MKYIRPKNWGELQHYKDRAPPWIKLHKKLLDDYEFQSLPVASRALAPMLWLLASEYENGQIPSDTRKLAFRLRMTLEGLAAAFEPLLRHGFFEIIGNDSDDDSRPLAEPAQVAMPETEKKETQVTSEETESISAKVASPVAVAPLPEIPIPKFLDRRKAAPHPINGHAADFQSFYDAYPLHKSRRSAEKAYVAALKRAPPAAILAGAIRYAADPDRKPDFTKHPATWLNADGWADDAEGTGNTTSINEFVRRIAEAESKAET